MPLNLLKKYNALLELVAYSPAERTKSLKAVFDRDITNNKAFRFRAKQITPTPQDGEIKMSTLFTHLTCVIIDKKTRKREFDIHRSVRLHWVKYHLDEKKKDNVLVFSVKEPEGERTYIYDKDEQYVIVLEPLRKIKAYYLLSAYYVQGKDSKRGKFQRKYERRLPEVL